MADLTTLSPRDVETFLRGIRSERDRLLAVLMVGAGLRCAEACALTCGDVNVRVGTLRVRCGKGGKDRVAIVRPEFRARIAAAVAGRPADSLVAPASTAGAVATANVRRAFLVASYWTRVECHPHLLRHTYAVELARRLPLMYVQQSLGHSRATTTDIYLKKVGCDALAEQGAALLKGGV